MDLAQIERQRLASQLVVAVESAAVLLAGAMSQSVAPIESMSADNLTRVKQAQPEANSKDADPLSSSTSTASVSAASLAYLRVTDIAYVSVSSLDLLNKNADDSGAAGSGAHSVAAATSSAAHLNRSFELTFPSANSVLGTKWAPSESTGSGASSAPSPTSLQRFVLRLNASPSATQPLPSSTDSTGKFANSLCLREGLTKLKTETVCHL